MKNAELLLPDFWRLLTAPERALWQNKPAYRRQIEHRAAQYLRILQLLADGLIYKQIGPELNLSSRTVEAYVQSMTAATGAGGVTHLVALALREELIQ